MDTLSLSSLLFAHFEDHETTLLGLVAGSTRRLLLLSLVLLVLLVLLMLLMLVVFGGVGGATPQRQVLNTV